MLNYGDVSVNYSYVMLYDPLNPIIMVWMFNCVKPRWRVDSRVTVVDIQSVTHTRLFILLCLD